MCASLSGPAPSSSGDPGPTPRTPPPGPPSGDSSPAEAPVSRRRPIRIQVLLNALVLDGPGRLVAGLAEQWVRQDDVALRVSALTRGGPLQKTFGDLGVYVESLDARGLKTLSVARRWARLLRGSAPPDVLHTHLARPDVVGPFVAPLMGRPKVVSTNHGLHAWQEKGRALGWLYGRLFRARQRAIDRVVAVSRSVADDLESAGIRRDRIDLIPNGVDPEVFRPAAGGMKKEFRRLLGIEPAEGFLILLVGNLIPLKGHEYCLRALPAILETHADTRILLVGEGPLEETLFSLARELGVGDAVKRISPLSVLLPKVMAAADVLVHPSLTESFGLVVAEAQACGLPVVATRIGGPAEILSDGETGFLVPPRDWQAIARAVVDLFSNLEVLREMGAAGRQRVLHLYDIRRCAADYLDLFHRLVGSQTR